MTWNKFMIVGDGGSGLDDNDNDDNCKLFSRKYIFYTLNL